MASWRGIGLAPSHSRETRTVKGWNIVRFLNTGNGWLLLFASILLLFIRQQPLFSRQPAGLVDEGNENPMTLLITLYSDSKGFFIH